MNRVSETDKPDPMRRAAWVVAALTMVGAALRGWPVGRLGLDHFDEGIYALAGSWSLSHGGLAALSPTLIPYAPPGFILLVGVMYAVLGPSDVAAIAVSQIAGTVTIPVVAWIACRSFGLGAGVVAAALAAFSGSHIAFSRMALTDPLFLLAWLLAIGAGQRFLERPGPWRAIILGLAVGLAQQCKYNGWLAGGIIAAAALVGVLCRPEERPMGRWGRSIGWGFVAVVVSAIVVWPWYHFVDQHGGYDALLRHQRSYLGGASAWWPNLRTQFEQSIALSGGWLFRSTAWAIALTALLFVTTLSPRHPIRRRIDRGELLLGAVLYFLLCINAPWWLGLAMLPILVRSTAPAARVLGSAWLILAILTPFYHPYARLWLPLHALGWIVAGGLFAGLAEFSVPDWARSRSELDRTSATRIGRRLWATWWIGVTAIFPILDAKTTYSARALGGLLGPSDSLRDAVADLVAQIPEEVTTIRVLARPPVTFYLGGRKAVWPQEGLESLAHPSDPLVWAIYDSGLGSSATPDQELPALIQEKWDVVSSTPTTLSLPTLLDINPAAARAEDDAIASRRVRLWLLRPRRAGGGR